MNILSKRNCLFFSFILLTIFCEAQNDLSSKSTIVETSKTSYLGIGSLKSVGMDSIFLYQKIDSIANEAIEAKAFPGMQVLIAKSGKIVFHKAYGFHTYENKKNVQLADLYDFASVSKITTALPALMKLHGEGKTMDSVLDYNDKKEWKIQMANFEKKEN